MIRGLFDTILDDILEIVIQHVEAKDKNQLLFHDQNARTAIKHYLTERFEL